MGIHALGIAVGGGRGGAGIALRFTIGIVPGQAVYGSPVFFFQGAAPLDALGSTVRFAFLRVAAGEPVPANCSGTSLPSLSLVVSTDTTSSSGSDFTNRPSLDV